MPSSPRRHGQDKTVSGLNRIVDKSRLSATENLETVLSSLEMRQGTENSLDLSPIKFTPRTRQDKAVLSCLCRWYRHNSTQPRTHNKYRPIKL